MRWLILLLIVGAIALVFWFKAAGRRTPISSGTIVFLGDSITAGYGLDPKQAYPSLIDIPGMTALNLGVSGSKTDDGLQRLKDYFNGGGKPQLVVIALGANDLLGGVPANAIEANLNAMVQECSSRGIPVMLCGIWIPGVIGANEIFDDVSSKNHVPLLPDLMQGEQTNENLLQEDHMHPTADGQKLIAAKMQEALLQHFIFGKS